MDATSCEPGGVVDPHKLLKELGMPRCNVQVLLARGKMTTINDAYINALLAGSYYLVTDRAFCFDDIARAS